MSVTVNEPANQVIVTDPSGGAIKVVTVGLRGPAGGDPSVGNLLVGTGTLQNEITVKSSTSRDLIISANLESPSANVIFASNVMPSGNAVQSLGAPDKLWKDIHVSDGTIFIGTNSSISSTQINIGNFNVAADGSISVPGVNIAADANAVDTVTIVASDIASNALIQATTGALSDLATDAKTNLVAAINEVHALTAHGDGLSVTSANLGDIEIFSANIRSTTGDITVTGVDLRVQGNLIVEGSTTSVESVTTVVEDPVFTLGGNAALTLDDGKDRGIEFRYYSGGSKLGYFGWDSSDGIYVFLKDATNSSEQFSGTDADLRANLFVGDLLASSITVTDALTAVTLNVSTLTANSISAEVSGSVTGNVTGNVVSDSVSAGTITITNSNLSSTSNIYISANDSIHLQSDVIASIVQTENVRIGNGTTLIDTTIASNVSVGEQTISQFPLSEFKFAKLIINTEDLTYGQSQISEVLLTHDNTNVRLTEYAILHTSTNPFVTFNAFIEANTVVVKASTQSSDNLIKVTRILN